MKRLSLFITALICLPVQAGSKLRDPTRPLATMVRPGATAPAPDAQPLGPSSLPVLQLVLVGGDRRYAVIDGELLAEGETFRGLPLLQVMKDAVVLKTPSGPRTLPLSPLPDPEKESP